MANAIVSHRDFVQMFISLLSGSGIAFTEKGAVSWPEQKQCKQNFISSILGRSYVVQGAARFPCKTSS